MIAVEIMPGVIVFMTPLDFVMSSLYPNGCSSN